MKTTKNAIKVNVSSTFVADPMKDSFEYWAEKLNVKLDVEFLALNTVFRQLLDPVSAVRQNDGVNILIIRFDDWCRVEEGFEGETVGEGVTEAKVRRNIDELLNALETATEQTNSEYIVCVCPPSPNFTDINFAKLEQTLLNGLKAISGLFVISSAEILESCETDDYYDSYSDKIGHIPYKQIFFDAFGTLLFRKLYSLVSIPYKVIVLDCDNTLWKGIWAEDGAEGTRVDKCRTELQKLMIKQYQAGMLLCLCSKNDEPDVDKAFETINGMLLKPEHIVAKRINWQAKSKNIKSLASELELGLDSFIFIDDSPAECMEVKYNCPQVLTLCLPQDDAEIITFLKNVWAFDHLKVTDTDKNRTDMYLQNNKRKQLEQKSLSFEEFLNSLELKAEISPLQNVDFERAYQLSLRVNQFNFTGKRYAEGELKAMFADSNSKIISVKASDRFGDYGLIGLMLFTIVNDTLILENLMLSCRALCKGIEYKMLAEAGKLAKENGLCNIQLSFVKTDRNSPATEFIMFLVNKLKPSEISQNTYVFAADALAEITISDYLSGGSAIAKAVQDESIVKTEYEPHNIELIEEIANELNSAQKIHAEIVSRNHGKIGKRAEYVAPRNEIEQAVAEIWQQVLEIDNIGVNDGLFELGGESIKAIQILSRVREKFETDISLSVLFEGEITVAKLALAAQESILSGFDEETLAAELAAIENLTEEELEELLKVQV